MKRRLTATQTLAILLTFGIVLAGCTSSGSVQKAGLSPSAADEEIPIGYGTQRKSAVTGAVETIDVEKALREGPARSVSDILRGRTSGVIVTESPGGGITLRIRSVARPGADPLYVIDGVPVTPDPGGALPWLNPHDIASISVLKDAASTAIYGMRGANGVIVITTKVGRFRW